MSDKAADAETLFQAALDALEEKGEQLEYIRKLGLRGVITASLGAVSNTEYLAVNIRADFGEVFSMSDSELSGHLQRKATQVLLDELIKRRYVKFVTTARDPLDGGGIHARLVLGHSRR